VQILFCLAEKSKFSLKALKDEKLKGCFDALESQKLIHADMSAQIKYLQALLKSKIVRFNKIS